MHGLDHIPPASERLPSASIIADATADAYFTGDKDSFPALSTNDFVIVGQTRLMVADQNIEIFSGRINDENNRFRILGRTGTSNYLRLLWTQNTPVAVTVDASCDLSANEDLASSCTHWGIIRQGGTVTVYVYDASAHTLLSASAPCGATADPGLFSTHASTVTQMGRYTTSTAQSRAQGLLAFAVTSDISGHNLDTDEGIITLLMDPQALFTHCGFTASQITAYGNLVTSGDVAIEPTLVHTLAAGEKLVCPFTDKYLTCAIDNAGSGQHEAFPPYTLPATGPGLLLPSSPLNDANPRALDGEGVVVVADQVVDPGDNTPMTVLSVLSKETGKAVRWPVVCRTRVDYVDSSNSNQRGSIYNRIAGATKIGDTHNDVALQRNGASLLVQHYGHQTSLANLPASGDRLLWSQLYQRLDRYGMGGLSYVEPYTSQPWGSAYSGNETAYEADLCTYSCMGHQSDGSVIECHRVHDVGPGYSVAVGITEAGVPTRRQLTVAGGLVDGASPRGIVCFSDGYSAIVTNPRETGSTGFAAICVYLAPPVASFATDGAWYTPDGIACDGLTSGVEAIGSIPTDNHHFMLPSDNNRALYAADTAGVDEERVTAVARFRTATEEGLILVKGVGVGTIDRSGGLEITKHVLERYLYDSDTHTLTRTHAIDFSSDSAALVTGTDPHNGSLEDWQNQLLTAHQVRGNDLLVYYVDHQGQANTAGVDTSGSALWAGQQIKGLYWPDVANNPYYRRPLTDPIFDCGDNSDVLTAQPQQVGDPNCACPYVLIRASIGEAIESYWARCRNELVDVSAMLPLTATLDIDPIARAVGVGTQSLPGDTAEATRRAIYAGAL